MTRAQETVLFAHPGAELFGADRMLLESVIAARDAGYRCVAVLPEHGPLVRPLQEAGATTVIVPSLVLRKALMTPRGWPRLVANTLRGTVAAWQTLGRARPACVMVNTITLPLWPLLARLRGIPAVSHVHEAEASGSALVNRLLYLPHLAARRILVNSQVSLDTMARSLPSLARRAQIVYNGVVGPRDARPPRPALTTPLRVLYVGRLSPRKGPMVLVDAIRLLAEAGTQVRVGLLGSTFTGYEWFEAALRQAIDEGSLGERVELHGFHSSIWPFLERADVLVVPSTGDESFGNTAVEGVLAMRPVIASDIDGLREAVGHSPTTRLVSPGDPEALAAALIAMAEEWPALVAAVEQSRAQAQERHDPSVYRAAIVGVLSSAISGCRALRRRSSPALDAV